MSSPRVPMLELEEARKRALEAGIPEAIAELTTAAQAPR